MPTNALNVAILIDAWFPFLGGAQKNVREITGVLKKKRNIDFKIFHSFSVNYVARLLWVFYVIPQVVFDHFFKQRFDLIHAHAFLAGLPAKALSVILGIPVVLTIHGTGLGAWQEMERGILGNIKERIEQRLLFGIKYTAQISVSSDILKFPNVNKKIFIISNGVNLKEFGRVKVNKAPGFKILFVGRLHIQKGLVYLIKAMKKIVSEHPEVYLHIVGVGPQEESLRKITEELEIVNFVRFKGQKVGKALVKEYKSSHLFVLPSLYEGQPLTLLEAWAAKLPVVVSKTGENPRMVRTGVNGYLVRPGKVAELVQVIIKARENPDLKKLGNKGYRLVKKEFNWQKITQKTLRVYQRVLS